MNKHQQMVRDFHIKYNCLHNNKPTKVDTKTLLLRSRLLQEEVAEFTTSASNEDMVGMIDALCDILYVTYGAAVCLGVDLEPVFAEVQRSNMTKDGGGQDVGGKVTKGPNFSEPDIEGELREQGYLSYCPT